MARSLERVKSWLHTSDLKRWIRQVWPENEPEEKTARAFSDRSVRTGSLGSQAGPTDEELARIERGSIPTLLDFEDPGSSRDFVQATAQEEQHPIEAPHDVSAAPSTIGKELAERMLRSATANDSN